MSTRSQTPLVIPIGIELERILRNSKAATADSKSINEANFAAKFAQACRVDDLWRGNLDVLLG